MNYYWNDVPGIGHCRNNLIYTSLINNNETIFCQWFYNDENYHKGHNEVVDPALMQNKMDREIRGLNYLKQSKYSSIIPNFNIDNTNKKIYLQIEGKDFWNRAKCQVENYNKVLVDWEQQMLDILQAHKNLGLYKFSLHPSSYFIVQGQLKSFNYFFHYLDNEGPITIADHISHIYSTRQNIMRKQVQKMGISWDGPESLNTLQHLCFESFRNNYTDSFINQAKEIYND